MDVGMGILAQLDEVIKAIGGGTPTPPAKIVVGYTGDSGCVGFGTASSADTGFNATASQSGVSYNRRYAIAVGPPPTLIDYPSALTLGALAPYDVPGNQSMGCEISLGQMLATMTAGPAIFEYGITGSTLAVEWNVTGTYPASGAGRLYNLMVAQFHALETSFGKILDVLVIELGANDAASGPQSAAFGASMGAMITQARIDFPGVKIVLVKPNVFNTLVPGANLTTIRSAIDTIVAGDPTVRVVTTDGMPLSGTFHATSNGYLSQGQAVAQEVGIALGLSNKAVTVTPDVVEFGPIASGSTGSLVVVPPYREQDNDLEVMVVLSGKVAGSITAPGDWTQLLNGSTTGGGETHRLAVFSRPVAAATLAANGGHMPYPTLTITTSNRTAAWIATVRKPDGSLPTLNASLLTTPNTVVGAGVGSTITGLTTSIDNALVMLWACGGCGGDGTYVVTAAGLSSVREVKDSVANIATDREIISLTVGRLLAHGSTLNPTATPSNNTVAIHAALAFV